MRSTHIKETSYLKNTCSILICNCFTLKKAFLPQSSPIVTGKYKFSYVATFDGIKENDFNLNIWRFVDTFEEEAGMGIAAVQNEIVKLEEELKTVQAELDIYLKELVV